MTSNCNECGRKTPKKVYLCNPCINFDPDYSDYRTEWEIWDEKAFLAAEAMMAEETALEEFLRKEDALQDAYWEDMWKKEQTALHALTGN